jgi:NAD(P)-dependent dehydrogenase (short-subunit alcohol dehydrogenase family)
MNISMSGKTALVTGGSRGIGRAIVRSLAASGAYVIVHYGRSAEEAERLVEELGRDRCMAIRADPSEPGAADRLWAQALAGGRRIDCFVSNAALVQPLTIDDDPASWDAVWAETLQVNVRSVADLCRGAIHHFRSAGGGTIVSIASRAAFRGDDPHLMHYAASKGAVVALTRSIARNFAAEKILAYVVAPGFVRTERQEGVILERGEAAMVRDIPLGEMASPDDVAAVVAFLASGAARHATGATIDINGASYFH